MKPIRYTLLIVGMLSLASIGRAQITVISDDFSTIGSLTGTTPDSGVGNWANISGTSGSISVSSGVLSLLGSGTSEATQLNFASSNQTSGTIYFGFDFTISSTGTINTSDSVQAIAGFRTGTAASGSYAVSFGDFRPSGAAITKNAGLSSTSTSQADVGIFSGSTLNASTNSLVYWGTPLTRGTTYRAVMGFNLTSDTVTLWVNPTSTSSTSITLTSITAASDGIFVRQGNASNGNVSLDNLAVSNAFSAAANISAVPEPSTYVMIAGVAALGFAAWKRRKRSSIAG